MKSQLVVWITGASSGMGRDLAQQYLTDGYQVVATARRQDLLEELRTYCKRDDQLLVAPADVADSDALDGVAAQIAQHFGRLDVVVAGAGYAVYGTFEELSVADYRRQFEPNVFGVLATLKAALPLLKKSAGQACIIGSVSGHLGLPRRSAYAMSKFALRGLAESLRVEWEGFGVGLTLVAPGYVDTPTRHMDNAGNPTGRALHEAPKHLLYPSAKAAAEIKNAIRRRRPFQIITGHGRLTIYVQRLFPGLINFVMRLRVRKQGHAHVERAVSDL